MNVPANARAAVQRFIDVAENVSALLENFTKSHVDKFAVARNALRVELTSQQEVAAPVGDALKAARQFIAEEAFPIGWNLDRIDAVLAASRDQANLAGTGPTYDKQEIDILVHQITGCDEAADSIEDLKDAVRMLEGKTILDLLNAEHDSALASQPKAPAPVVPDMYEINGVGYLPENLPLGVTKEQCAPLYRATPPGGAGGDVEQGPVTAALACVDELDGEVDAGWSETARHALRKIRPLLNMLATPAAGQGHV